MNHKPILLNGTRVACAMTVMFKHNLTADFNKIVILVILNELSKINIPKFKYIAKK